MKKLVAVLSVVIIAAACGDNLVYEEVELPDGRKIDCVHDDGRRLTALSCDWNTDGR